MSVQFTSTLIIHPTRGSEKQTGFDDVARPQGTALTS